jgi:hypothetical protein
MDLKQLFGRLAKADFADSIGVAIADDVVSAAHVRKRLHTVSVHAIASRPIDVPRESRTALVVDFIRDFAAEHGIDEARLCVALEPADVLFGRLQLPATATENFDAVVGYELDRIFPLPPDALLTDQYWRPLGVTGERVHATIVAGVRERIEQLQRELAAAGWAPSAFTVLPVALSDFYAYCRTGAGDGTRTAGIFYPTGEAGRETMVVSSRGLMISSVTFDPRSETRSERLWRELETLAPEAIQDEVETVVDGEATDDAVSLGALAPAALFGGAGDVHPELRWYEAAALGAALAQVGEAKEKLNLLPPGTAKAEEGVGLRELGLSAVVVVLALVLAATIALKNLSIGNALAGEVESLLPRVSEVQKRREENRRMLEKVKLLERHRATNVLTLLRAMTEQVPPTAYLTTFRFRGDRIEVDGIATSAASLISDLERSPHFRDVEFTAPTTKYLQDQERFSLRMGLEQ